MAELGSDTKRLMADMLKKKADKNGDKYLNGKEILLAFAACGCTVKTEDLKFMQTALDTDGDGKIHIEELVNNLDVMMIHDIRGDELIDAFKRFDKDGSGFIRRYELKQILTSPGHYQFDGEAATELLDELFEKYDRNKDEKLSYAEFVRMFNDSTDTKFEVLQQVVDDETQQRK